MVEVIEEITDAYVSWRYGGQMPNIQQLKQRLRDLIKNDSSNGRLKGINYLLTKIEDYSSFRDDFDSKKYMADNDCWQNVAKK